MSRRIVIGKRANGDLGVFVAPQGYDAYTALDSSLSLGVSTKIAGLIKIGYASSNQYVSLALGVAPVIILTGTATFPIAFQTDIYGLTRPAPFGRNPNTASSAYAYVSISSDGSGMTVVTPYNVRYEVYNRSIY